MQKVQRDSDLKKFRKEDYNMKEVRNILKSYEIYADVFSYPEESLRSKIKNVQKHLEEFYNEEANLFFEFSEFASSIELKKWEEIYTRTFDVQALTTIDLGYVLFGDDYKRGELLVNLSKEHKKVNNECSSELADHLPNVLRLLRKLNDNDLLEDIIALILKPALSKIASEFDTNHIEKKSKVYQKHHRTIIEKDIQYALIYRNAIDTLLLMLNKDFPGNNLDSTEDKSFTRQISTELEIEKLG